MKKLFFIIIVLSTLLSFSCSDNAFQEMLFRTTDDPFQDIPVTDSLALEHTVFLTWEKDEGCDIYRLMRSYDNFSGLEFDCIYEGTETSYIDENLPYGDRYVYRLDKTRGTKYFEGKSYAYGYSSDCRRDECEPNDFEDMATHLDSDLNCILNCVSYYTNNVKTMDCDYFYVELPAVRVAEIKIDELGLDDGKGTRLMFQQLGMTPENIISGDAYEVVNPDFEAGKKYFKIYPVSTELFDGQTNIASIGYTISLNRITIYVNN
jgi:hypothetical protein